MTIPQYPGFTAVPGPNGQIQYVPAAPQQPPPAPQHYPGMPPAAGYPMPAPPTGYPQQPWAPQPPPVAPAFAFGAPPMPPGYGAPQPPPPMPAAPPAYYIPSAAEFAAMQARAQQQAAEIAARRAAGGGGAGKRKNIEVKFLGPNGETKWDRVPVGFERRIIFRLLPSPSQGLAYFLEANKHFYKSKAHPQGTGGWCPAEGCRVCAAVTAAFKAGGDTNYKRAQMARAQGHYLYQGLEYGAAELHRGEDGRCHPRIFDAKRTVHGKIMDLAGARGLPALLDLERASPLQVKRKKTGPEAQNIDYELLDLTSHAGPIPPEFGFGPRGEGLELLDLRKFAKPMDQEAQEKAIAELEFTSGAAYSYNQAPTPPAPSPYQAQAPQPPPFMPPMPPQQAVPPQPWNPAPGAPLPSMGASQPPPWQPSAPPVLPSTGQPMPGSYAAPKDPWGEAAAPESAVPPGWQPPAPPAAPPASTWAAPTTPDPKLLELQAQLLGQMQPPSTPAAGPGPAFPPPPVSAPPTR